MGQTGDYQNNGQIQDILANTENTGNTGWLGGLLYHKAPLKFSYFALPEFF